MVSIVGFGRPKFGASTAVKSEPAAKTTKNQKHAQSVVKQLNK